MNNLLNRRGSTYTSGASKLYNKIILLVPRGSLGTIEDSKGIAMMTAIKSLFDTVLYNSDGTPMSGYGIYPDFAPDVTKFYGSRNTGFLRNRTAPTSGSTVSQYSTWTLQDDNYWYQLLPGTTHETGYSRDVIKDGAKYKSGYNEEATFYTNCFTIIPELPDDNVIILYWTGSVWEIVTPDIYVSGCDYNNYNDSDHFYSARYDESTDLYYNKFWSDSFISGKYNKTKYCFINTSNLLIGNWKFYGSTVSQLNPYAKYIGEATVKTGRLNGIFVSYLD